ncbi:MAG: sugar phosphate isomerase/epimerase [Treponema sp.]|jgi:D-psicose/D-tagatose/L-ribulose 3-epimerase|nr:sugar phosphate isomerase/epimerase [Treponema sp.]
MKYGIYYAYWERQWGGDYIKYVKKAAALGFDILEISCAQLADMKEEDIQTFAQAAKDSGLILTGGYGPKASENISSSDPAVVSHAMDFWERTFAVLQKLNITLVGGGIYSYWPVDYSAPFNKAADLDRSVKNMRLLARKAASYGITLGMEALNRFEGYLINTAEECIAYVKAVDEPNIKVMLDTFHMNIEEDSLSDAIRSAGSYLGHFHIGEPNRRPPRKQSRMDWPAIGRALNDIHYMGAVVMEPFVLQGGQVGEDIKVWRDISRGASEQDLDEEARTSVRFIREVFA